MAWAQERMGGEKFFSQYTYFFPGILQTKEIGSDTKQVAIGRVSRMKIVTLFQLQITILYLYATEKEQRNKKNAVFVAVIENINDTLGKWLEVIFSM